MGSLFDRIVRRIAPKSAAPETPQVNLAAFGKHPGWDDHIEDIGLETQRLIDFKRTVYVQGIGGAIDSGTWDNLDPSQRIEQFKHVFLWCGQGGIIAGRMWSSRDGKGRTRYPMAVCAECLGLGLDWVLGNVLPRLEAVQQRCMAATTAADVLAILDQSRQELRQQATAVAAGGAKGSSAAWAIAALAGCPRMGADQEGLLRVFYQMRPELEAYASGHIPTGSRFEPGRTMVVRVPPCADAPADVARLWLDFVLGQMTPPGGVFLLYPMGESWVDLIVGEPTPRNVLPPRGPEGHSAHQ